MKKSLILLLLLISVCTFGKTILKISHNIPESRVKIGETVKFDITLQGDKIAGETIKIDLRGNSRISKVYTVKSDGQGKYSLSVPAVRPGFIYLRVTHGKTMRASGIAVEPEKVTPGLPEPDDFDAFWNGIKAKLNAAPVNAIVTPVNCTNSKISGFKVQIPMGGKDKDAYAALTMPKNAAPKSLPAILICHGAGTDRVNPDEKRPLQFGGMLVLSLNPMPVDHNGRNGATIWGANGKRSTKRGPYYGYQGRGANDRDKIFFNAMFQRLYQALRFLKSRPEWDGKTLIVYGGSQGGGQALAAAGLDPQVTCCIAFVPAICNHGGSHAGGISGWPSYYRTKQYNRDKEAILRASSYIDCVNFARRITNAECLLSTGYIDPVCPSESVYAAFNVIPAKNKRIICTPNGTHRIPRATLQAAERMIKQHISNARNK